MVGCSVQWQAAETISEYTVVACCYVQRLFLSHRSQLLKLLYSRMVLILAVTHGKINILIA